MYIIMILEVLIVLIVYYFNCIDILFIMAMVCMLQYVIIYDYLEERENVYSSLAQKCKVIEILDCNIKNKLILYSLYVSIILLVGYKLYNVIKKK